MPKLENKDGSPTAYAFACGYKQVACDHMGGRFEISQLPHARAYTLTGRDWTGADVKAGPFKTLTEARAHLRGYLA